MSTNHTSHRLNSNTVVFLMEALALNKPRRYIPLNKDIKPNQTLFSISRDR